MATKTKQKATKTNEDLRMSRTKDVDNYMISDMSDFFKILIMFTIGLLIITVLSIPDMLNSYDCKKIYHGEYREPNCYYAKNGKLEVLKMPLLEGVKRRMN